VLTLTFSLRIPNNPKASCLAPCLNLPEVQAVIRYLRLFVGTLFVETLLLKETPSEVTNMSTQSTSPVGRKGKSPALESASVAELTKKLEELKLE